MGAVRVHQHTSIFLAPLLKVILLDASGLGEVSGSQVRALHRGSQFEGGNSHGRGSDGFEGNLSRGREGGPEGGAANAVPEGVC